MKTTFALLPDTETQNRVRKLIWQIHQEYQTGIEICRLPPHISLKQPFDVADISLLETYMDELAIDTPPFNARLSELQLIETNINDLETGILWFDVVEVPILRQLHNRLNEELLTKFGGTTADFDGDNYRFHLSVAIGGQPVEIYREIIARFSQEYKDIPCQVEKLAMFVYDQNEDGSWAYATYKTLPLGSLESTE